MPSQPKVLLDLAQRFLDEAPWDYIPERCVFLVRVPGRELPLTATVLGDSVSLMGLELNLEPDGLQRLAHLHHPDTKDEDIEAFRPGRCLNVAFLPASEIPPDFKKVWKAAGFRALGGTFAPQLAAAVDGEEVRPIKRSEGTLLAYAMHAVLDALEVQTLSSPDISEDVAATLLITVPGDDPGALETQQLPPTRAQIVPRPGADGVIPEYSPLTKGAATRLRALPVDPAPLAAVLFPSRVEGADEDRWVMLFFDPLGEELLGTEFLGEDADDAREMALVSFLLKRGQRPADFVIEGAAFALWAFAAAEQIGIEARYGQFLGPFADVVDREVAASGGAPIQRGTSEEGLDDPWGAEPAGSTVEDPQTPEEWAQTHGTISWLAREVLETVADDEVARSRYFGGARTSERMVELMGSLGADDAFWGYATEDFRRDPGRATVVESLYEKREDLELNPGEVEDLRARLDATVSLFEISGDGSKVTDLLTEQSFPLDLDFGKVSRLARGGLSVLRHYRLGGLHAFAPAGPPWDADSKETFRLEIDEVLGSKPSHAALRSEGARLGQGWGRFVQRLAPVLEALRTGDLGQ